MKQLVFFLTLIWSIVATPAYSQNYALGIIGGGASINTENENAEGGTGYNIFYDSVTGPLLYRVSVGSFESNTKVNLLSKGSYSQMWIEGSLLLLSKPSASSELYFGGGYGSYYFTNLPSSEVTMALASLGAYLFERIEDTRGFHIRGGSNLEFNSKMDFNIDVKYAFIKPEVEVKIIGYGTEVTERDEINLNTLSINLGVRFKI